jgi:hypothetical protein
VIHASAVVPAKRERSEHEPGPMNTGLPPLRDCIKQIMPIRIMRFDQRNFPIPSPFLHLLFSGDSGNRIIEDLEIHEPINGVPLRKTGNGLDAVFMNP